MAQYNETRHREIIRVLLEAAQDLDRLVTDQELHNALFFGEQDCEAVLGEPWIGETFVAGPNGPVGVRSQRLIEDVEDEMVAELEREGSDGCD